MYIGCHEQRCALQPPKFSCRPSTINHSTSQRYCWFFANANRLWLKFAQNFFRHIWRQYIFQSKKRYGSVESTARLKGRCWSKSGTTAYWERTTISHIGCCLREIGFYAPATWKWDAVTGDLASTAQVSLTCPSLHCPSRQETETKKKSSSDLTAGVGLLLATWLVISSGLWRMSNTIPPDSFPIDLMRAAKKFMTIFQHLKWNALFTKKKSGLHTKFEAYFA